ncbi:ArsR/SmtB family transcription factor [Phaeodactylibacter luteus]|nr:metalloregulator ArsR/SmtB family transcription factor [Phaeodactylibacter luteus]
MAKGEFMVVNSSFERYGRQAEQLRAIAHPLRLAIIGLLHREGAQSVTQIYEALGVEQATASHHLKIMRQSEVLRTVRKGRFTYYELAGQEYPKILAMLSGEG